MSTRRENVDGQTPAAWATSHGYDDRMNRVVRDVRRRAADLRLAEARTIVA